MEAAEATDGKAEGLPQPPKVDVADVSEFARQVMQFAFLVRTEDVERLVAEIDRTDTLMPILDPTGWMKIRRNIPAHKKLAHALLAFRREIDEIVAMEAALHARV